MHQCPLCEDFWVPTFQLLLQHIGRTHGNSSNFRIVCGVEGCSTTFTNFHAFRRHLRKKHRAFLAQPPRHSLQEESSSNGAERDDVGGDSVCGGLENDDCPDIPTQQKAESSDEMKRNAAMWILKVKEGRKLTQSCTEEILQDVSELCTYTVGQVGLKVAEVLRSSGKELEDVPGLNEIFQGTSQYCQPFSHIDTQYLQLSYFRSNLNFVDPVDMTLGSHYQWRGEGSTRRLLTVKETYVYIPLLQVLQAMLKCSSVFEEIIRGHSRLDDVMEDFCDSPRAKEHPLFGTNSDSTALQIFLYFDELELCNPLGSYRKKHKIGCYYYVLGNLSPKYRSTLKAIQLLALVTAPVLEKYGHDEVLKPAIADLIILEGGVTFQTCKGPMQFRGTVVAALGDNPGSNGLGGFKEGSTAFRCCRQCMGTRDDMKSKFHEKHFTLRSQSDHADHCQSLANPSLAEHYSTTYGVNRDSSLNSLTYFHVCDETMPPDILHDILEGYLPYKVKLMLVHFIKIQKYFKLTDLNETLVNLQYGYCETSSIPTPISPTTLNSEEKTKMCQSASQMWTLGRLLPMMVGHMIPEDDPHWVHYLQLLEIVDHVFAPTVEPATPAYIEVLLEENLQDFTELYPGHSVIPKMHFLVHVPRFMARIGPMVCHWTMRFEAKHQYFKQLAMRIGNFINISHSLALRHQSYQCYILSSDSGLCHDKHNIGKGTITLIEESEFHHELSVLPGMEAQIFR